MIKKLILGAALLFIGGCTVQVSDNGEKALAQENGGLPVDIQLQRLSSYPKGGSVVIPASQMKAGDILLTSPYGPTSLGIRLFSGSTVSHAAIYLGDDKVVEAVGGSGVQIVTLAQALDHNSKIVVMRVPGLTEEQALSILNFSEENLGKNYNYNGVALMAPFMLTRQLCSLNPFSSEFRDSCISMMAQIQLGNDEDAKGNYFCSQFVIEAYNRAGLPITKSAPVWISPVDLLHMREGDVASFTPNVPLQYVGHLKRGTVESATVAVRQFFHID